MSLNVALNTAVSGLFANQRAIAATSENVANVNTADFVRRDVNFFTDNIPGQFAGVDVEITRSAVDRFVQGASFQGNADATRSGIVADALSRVEASLGAPGDNISYANQLDEAFAALTALAASPSSAAARADAVVALDEAFAAFARTQEAITAEINAAGDQAEISIERANALLEEIFRLNASAPDSPSAGDLIDARISELSSLLNINVDRADDGRVTVSTQNGTVLANSAGYAALGFTDGPPSALTLSSVDGDGNVGAVISANIETEIASGELRGLLDLRNIELPALARLVGQAAQGVSDELNAAYALNTAVGATSTTVDPLIVNDGTGVFSVNASIAADPVSFAVARPTAGNAGGANDGLGAAALASVSASTAVSDTAQSVALVGSAARNAALSAQTNGAIAAELSARASAEGGVNLDEELSNLILYQRAYNANARVIAAVDELWQSLLSII